MLSSGRLLSNAVRQQTQQQARNFSAISGIHAREVLDSRGNPTVEVDLKIDGNDNVFRAIVPSGASTGAYEAVELRDGDKNRYLGKGVIKAVDNVNNELKQAVLGMDVTDQSALDQKMIDLDGTPNKGRLGANAILGVSMAAAAAGAGARKVPLYKHFADLAGNPHVDLMPQMMFNVINGGEHALNSLAFQEFFIIPTGANSTKEGLQLAAEVFHKLKSLLKQKYGGNATLIGDEGGFAPPVDADQGLSVLMEAIDAAGHTGKIHLGLDVASSEFKVPGEDKYDLDFKTTGPEKNTDMILTGDQLIDYYANLCEKYPIVTIEDGCDQDDWDHWVKLVSKLGDKVQIVGDDLTVTNPEKIQKAIDLKAANALLLKVNQIGSITESIEAVKLSKQNGWGVMTSHRSGETEDVMIADLAVGLCTGQIKTGAPCRGERTAKYNQLLRIEEEIQTTSGTAPDFTGINFRQTKWMN